MQVSQVSEEGVYVLSIVTHSMTAAIALAISWALAPRKRKRGSFGPR